MKKVKMAVVLLLGVMLVSGLACGGEGEATPEQRYNLTKDKIQLATTAYMVDEDHYGAMPNAANSAGWICVCMLLGDVTDGWLWEIPNGVHATNCDAAVCGTYTCSYKTCDGSYGWWVNNYGIVSSTCMGTECDSNNADGYQGVFP